MSKTVKVSDHTYEMLLELMKRLHPQSYPQRTGRYEWFYYFYSFDDALEEVIKIADLHSK